MTHAQLEKRLNELETRLATVETAKNPYRSMTDDELLDAIAELVAADPAPPEEARRLFEDWQRDANGHWRRVDTQETAHVAPQGTNVTPPIPTHGPNAQALEAG